MFKHRRFLVGAVLATFLFTVIALSQDESPEDRLWAEAARTLIHDARSGLEIRERLAELLPDLAAQLDRDAGSDPALLEIWGRSLNYDEAARGEIVAPEILDSLLAWTGAPVRRERVVHAGVEHTYGYLFSLLKTPFGYKRARWVQGEIDAGFGLPRGTLSPAPMDGTLLANATVFFGSIAFRGESASVPVALAAEAVRAFAYDRLDSKRLVETVTFEDGRTVALRTDFVPFLYKDSARKNSWLLVYSVRDSAEAAGRLITAFPIEASFVDRALDPNGLGENRPVVTRYNAWIEDFTGTTRIGSRVLR